MADTNLSTSISAIRTKILNDAPTATVDELVSLARAAKSIGLTEDTSIETAINSRANTLSSNASTNDMVKLSNAIKQLRNTTAGAVSPSTTSDDIVEGTSNLYYTDVKVQTKLGDVSGHIIPDTNVTYDLGSAEKKFRHLYLSGNTLTLGSVNISDNDGSLEVTPVNGEGSSTTLSSGGATVYEDMNALIAATGMSNGDFALVTATNNIYIYNGSGWYKIATVQNDSPTAITGVDGTYELASDGTPTVITAVSTDPEGFPLTWSYAVTSGSLGTTATISQVDNVFTITPSTTESDAGTFELTFSATDGVNGAVNASSEFSLTFGPSYPILNTLSGSVTSAAATNPSQNNDYYCTPEGDFSFVSGAYAPVILEHTTHKNPTTTLRYNSLPSGATTLGGYWALTASQDGTRIFAAEYNVGGGNLKFYQWNYNLNTTVSTNGNGLSGTVGSSSVTFSVTRNRPANHNTFNINGLALSSDGTKLFHCAINSNYIYRWTLSTAFDINTIGTSPDQAVQVAGNVPCHDVQLSPDDKYLIYAAGNSGSTWTQKEFDPANPLDLNNLSAVTGGSKNFSSSGTSPLGACFLNDETSMFVYDTTNSQIDKYTV
jgi:hypothetical protein